MTDFTLLSDGELSETVLGGWHTLTPVLMRMNRRQLAVLLKAELSGPRRRPIAVRLHQRLSRLRAQEELKVIDQLVRDPLKGPVNWEMLDWLDVELQQ